MSPANIIYEQPLNEHVRFCLRLEYLFQKLKHYHDDESSWGSRIILETILEILSVVDRPDLKTKLSKALSLYAVPLAQLIQKQQLIKDAEQQKIEKLFAELNELVEELHANRSKIGHKLRENDFIATIVQRTTIAGGTSAFSVPAYHLWLELPIEVRRKDINQWIESFAEIKKLIDLVLQLTRKSAVFQTVEAKKGFYQLSLDTKISFQMIRIALPSCNAIYPEVSVGKHRLSVHFYELNTLGRPAQAIGDIKFNLACCKI